MRFNTPSTTGTYIKNESGGTDNHKDSTDNQDLGQD